MFLEDNLNAMLERANINRGNGNEVIKERFNEEIEKSKRVAIAANEYGYKFFSLNADDFEAYCNNVVNYLIE